MTGPPDGPALPLPPARPPGPDDDAPITVSEPRGPEPLEAPRAHERIGRYVVLRELGAGAMGVVLAAYDRDLDRKIAIKLLRAEIHDNADGVVRLRREAQAMARLSHPNVAQVYEVGQVRGQTFLAMEFIDGVTLRAWLGERPRPWPEVLRVFTDAGRGLAAAHAAGLAHRDFKPDNAMIDAHGRVRVLDFGLSRVRGALPPPDVTGPSHVDIAVTAAGSMLGTPAYMAPEQFCGGEADARSDQFGFCVALWEGLYGRRPFAGADVRELRANVIHGRMVAPPSGSRVPAWIRKVLTRGLSVTRSDRWPSLDVLLAALSRDPRQARRRLLAVSLGVAGIAAVGYGAAVHRQAEARECSGAADELAGVWDDARRLAVEKAVRATGVAYADATLVSGAARLDDYRSRWIAAHTEACESHRLGHVSDTLFDRRMVCLRERRAQLGATVDIVTQTTPDTVANATDTIAGLPPIAACEDDARLLAVVPPPADPAVAAAVERSRRQLAHLQALERNGRHAEALAAMDPLQREAERLAHGPHLAEVHLLAGKLAAHTLRYQSALPHLEQAEALAVEFSADIVAAEALAHWIYTVGFGAHRLDEAATAAPRAWAQVRRLGNPPGLAALLHNNTAAVYSERGETARAIAEYEAGLALLTAKAPDDPLRPALISNLADAWTLDNRNHEARVLLEPEIVRMAGAYGECHPHTAALRRQLAYCEANNARFDAAIALEEHVLVCFADALPGQALGALKDLMWIHLILRDDRPQTRRQIERAEPIFARHSEFAADRVVFDLYRVDLALRDDRVAEAKALLAGVQERLAADAGHHPNRAMFAEVWRAVVALRERDPNAALEHIDRAEQLAPTRVEPADRAVLDFTRARVLHALAREPAEVTALARAAITAYDAKGAGYATRSAEIKQWLATLDPVAGRGR